MKAGLDALYAHNNPTEAAAQFRKVLERNPNHYGATFQLALALERSHNVAEAQSMWKKMLTMAEDIKDTQTIALVHFHLGTSESVTTSEESMMKAGVESLYTRHDPAAAIVQFRQVLVQNPTHYGATFQLAAALDAIGQSEEASRIWMKVLAMAQGYGDTKTEEAVRARLAHGR